MIAAIVGFMPSQDRRLSIAMRSGRAANVVPNPATKPIISCNGIDIFNMQLLHSHRSHMASSSNVFGPHDRQQNSSSEADDNSQGSRKHAEPPHQMINQLLPDGQSRPRTFTGDRTNFLWGCFP